MRKRMTKAKLRKFKEMYQEMRDNIIRSINSTDKDLDLDGDDIDQVQGKALSEMQDRLSKRDLVRLTRLETALKKIEEGSFGICEDCGGVIGEKRLEIMPGTDQCINCAEQEEIQLRSYASA
jgi:DnaK suppressor protein